jgi:flagellar motor switch protein FliG
MAVSASIRRAALVLVSLDDDQASELMRRMSPREVEAITAAIESLHEIDPVEQASALKEFHERMGTTSPPPVNSLKSHRSKKLEVGLEDWPEDQIRMAFDPHQAEDWALALADCDQPVVDRILKSLNRTDRKQVLRADQSRGPWRLHEPHEARRRIQARIAEL